MHFALERFRLIRLDDTEKESVNRPHHGLALYVKEYFHFQKVVKLHCRPCEFILAAMHSIQKGYFQFVISSPEPLGSVVSLQYRQASVVRVCVNIFKHLLF